MSSNFYGLASSFIGWIVLGSRHLIFSHTYQVAGAVPGIRVVPGTR